MPNAETGRLNRKTEGYGLERRVLAEKAEISGKCLQQDTRNGSRNIKFN
jgi:hypothetical protein